MLAPSTFRFFAPVPYLIHPILQTIEINSYFQIPGIVLVGLPNQEVNESRERIRSALLQSGFEIPARRIIINLSPGSLKKQGTGTELAMALAMRFHQVSLSKKKSKNTESTSSLQTEEHLPDWIEEGGPIVRICAWGELTLDGQIRSVGTPGRALKGALAMVSGTCMDRIIFPEEDQKSITELLPIFLRATPSKKLPSIHFAKTIKEAIQIIERPSTPIQITAPKTNLASAASQNVDVLDPETLLPLNPLMKKIVTLAACGQHSLLLVGPRGSGKSRLLDWLIALRKPSDHALLLHHLLLKELRLNTAFSGEAPVKTDPTPMRGFIPIRRISPHSTPQTLVGRARGQHPIPGELALAHGGILIADEFAEWHRDTREALRIPIEEKKVRIPSLLVAQDLELPCDFQFLATANLCPCGGRSTHLNPSVSYQMPSDNPMDCRCGNREIAKYRARLSGPILDRIDLVYQLDSLESPGQTAQLKPAMEDFPRIKLQIQEAQELLIKAWGCLPGKIPAPKIQATIQQSSFLQKEMQRFHAFGMRTVHRAFRLALSQAALNQRTQPDTTDLQEVYWICQSPWDRG